MAGLMLSADFASVEFSPFDHPGGYVTLCGGLLALSTFKG